MPIHYGNVLPGKRACFELFTSTGWNDVYGVDENEYFDAVRASWYLVGAYEEDRLVGLGRVISDGALYALIVDVVVLPPYQRRGIGSAIMEQLLDRCRSSRVRDVKLFAAKGMSHFYQQFGFIERPAYAPGMGLLCGQGSAVSGTVSGTQCS